MNTQYKNKTDKGNAIIRQYFVLQAAFWLSLILVSFFTLTLWYQQFTFPYILHMLLQSVLGFFLSLPIHVVFLKIWHWPLWRRIAAAAISVLLVASVWTILRLLTFSWMTAEVMDFEDYGGWFFGSIYIFLCWAATFHGVRYYQLLEIEHVLALKAEADSRRDQVKLIEAKSDARDARLEMLRYQLNPHFLYNTLNSINALIQLEELDKASEMTINLSDFLRYSLDKNPDAKITLDNEIEALMLYLKVEQIRFGDRLKLDFVVSDEALAAGIPSLILQPLIENSMKYVIAKNEAGGTISLRANRENNDLLIELWDTGVENRQHRSKINNTINRGIGLRNTDERLKTLYQNKYDFELRFIEDGSLKILIRIPYETINGSK